MNLNYQEIFVAISIGLLYPFFFEKLIDVIYNRTLIDTMCEGIDYYLSGSTTQKNPKYDECEERKKPLTNRADTAKFIFLMIIGVVGIIVSGLFASKATSLGLALGGFLTITKAIFMYWSQMNEYMKLSITGASLALLIYLSVRFFS